MVGIGHLPWPLGLWRLSKKSLGSLFLFLWKHLSPLIVHLISLYSMDKF